MYLPTHLTSYPFSFLSTLSSVCDTQILLVVLPALECDLCARDNILKDNWLSPHKQLSMTNANLGTRVYVWLPCSTLELHCTLDYTCLVCTVSTTVSSHCNNCLNGVWKTLFHGNYPQPQVLLFPSLFHNNPHASGVCSISRSAI